MKYTAVISSILIQTQIDVNRHSYNFFLAKLQPAFIYSKQNSFQQSGIQNDLDLKPRISYWVKTKEMQTALKQTWEAVITCVCLVHNSEWVIVWDHADIESTMKIAVSLNCPEKMKKSLEKIKDEARVLGANC